MIFDLKSSVTKSCIRKLRKKNFPVAPDFSKTKCFKKLRCENGGFDEDFTMTWREDSALQFDLVENKIPIVKVDGAIVIHPVRVASRGVCIKEKKRTMLNPLLYKKHLFFINKKSTSALYGTTMV